MKFRTELIISEKRELISPDTQIFLSGSCFADNISSRLVKFHFNALGNPFGVLFNTASIYNLFKIVRSGTDLSYTDLVFNMDEWHSFYHNSEFSDISPERVIEKTNNSIASTRDFLLNSDMIILTFGTSFVFEYKESGMAVSNCHKIPQNKFEKKFLSVENNIKYIQDSLDIIGDTAPKAEVVLTVSPIRHLKNGLHGSQLSKASLLLAVDEIVRRNKNVSYFPSYELLLDDLRDYRFFAADLAHPSEEAVEYIWEKFTEAFFTHGAKEFLIDVQKLISAAEHKPRGASSPIYAAFLKTQLQNIEQLREKYPFADFSKEEEMFGSRLAQIS